VKAGYFSNVAWNATKAITPEIATPKVAITTTQTEMHDNTINVIMGKTTSNNSIITTTNDGTIRTFGSSGTNPIIGEIH